MTSAMRAGTRLISLLLPLFAASVPAHAGPPFASCQGVVFELVGHGIDAQEMKEALETEFQILGLREQVDRTAPVGAPVPVEIAGKIAQPEWERFKFRIDELCGWSRAQGASRIRFECERNGSDGWSCETAAVKPDGSLARQGNNLAGFDGDPVARSSRARRILVYRSWLHQMTNHGACLATGDGGLRGLSLAGTRLRAKKEIWVDRFGAMMGAGGRAVVEGGTYGILGFVISDGSREMGNCVWLGGAAKPGAFGMNVIPRGTEMVIQSVSVNDGARGGCGTQTRAVDLTLAEGAPFRTLSCELHDLDLPRGGDFERGAWALFDLTF